MDPTCPRREIACQTASHLRSTEAGSAYQWELVGCGSCLLHSRQDDETVVDVTGMADPDWDIRRDGRAWSGEEGLRRYALTPERFELIEGKLCGSDEERRVLLGLLLENLGADAAVRLGDPHVWLEAISHHTGWPIVDAVREEAIPVAANELPHDAQIAAALLGRVMADLSEDYWCAGWIHDLEFDLWSAMHGAGAPFTRSDLAQVKYLSTKCGGWIVWHDAAPWRRYVPLSVWEPMCAEWRRRPAK